MGRSSRDIAAAALAIVLAATAAGLLTRRGPDPTADVGRGTEDAFARGLQRRELPAGGGPQRWTSPRASFTFRDVATPAALVVEIRDARGPVAVVADGVVLGRLEGGVRAASFGLPPARGGTHEIELWAEPFRAGDGRLLGVRLGRVALEIRERPWRPPLRLVVLLALPALLGFAAARASSLSTAAALLLAGATIVFAAVLLWPAGLAHSPYAGRLSGLLGAGSALALAFAWAVARRHPAAAAAAFVALVAGWWVQVVLGTSPVMVVSDVVFHANKLAAVAGGDLFPLSVTQHAHPFRFPYGVSFYAVLAPLARAGLDTVTLVRAGAAAALLAATAAVFLLALAQGGPLVGAAAAVILQFLPGAFDVAYSYGNLSNAFGQAVTVLFFCWWAGRAPGGWPTGGLLLALAALAHFSSFVFAMALVAALVTVELRAGERDRTRLWAAALGVALAAAYYAHFAGMIWEQLPRLAEGSGQGRGPSSSVWAAAARQGRGAVGEWGVPAIALAVVGWPRSAWGRYERCLAASGLAGLALALPAIVSPLEVRYVYGLTAVIALCAAAGFARLEAKGGAARVLGRVLCAAQMALGARAIAEDVVSRYRP
jgi:hypothetical protein